VAGTQSRPGSVVTFEQFAVSRLRSLHRAATAMCGDPLLAEDLVQDTLVKAHMHWHRVSQADSPDAYVYRMLVNTHRSWRRKWGRIVPRATVETRSLKPDHAERHAEQDELRQRLSRLPRRQQTVLVLRYFAGLSDSDIAEAMGCAASTVRSNAARGLANLRADARAVPTSIEEST
jgi:RNA polymerase sigma-70 factor (sigma-E family)